jgi:iron complex outermembrane receptor protein
MIRSFSQALVLSLLVLTAAATDATAQQALPDLSLEDLMGMDSGRVFGASERLQPVTEAPSAVSFITAEEIKRYGYRTLADILRGVRGFYIADDRNFSLVGTRGFAKPGDYNSRILLLVNGHRVNDNVFGQAEIGAEFGIDPAMFERVEIIRGPASSLYGDSAFFAVINVITKRGASLDGVSVAVDTGTLGIYLTRASAGRRFANGLEVAVSGTLEGSEGNKQLYFPVFDTPATNNGIAEGLDGERSGQFYSHATYKGFTFTGAYGRRQRDVPTASYGSMFNSQEAPEQTADRHTLVDVEYARRIGGGRLALRGSFDRFSYDGTYAYPTPEDPRSVGKDMVIGSRWTASTKFTRPLPGRQQLTVGTDYIDNIEQRQQFRFENPTGLLFAVDRSSIQSAVYAQDEVRLTPWLIANGGLRYDHYESFSRVTPRAALIAIPSSNQSFKYLYGRAFRAPNLFELNTFYYGPDVVNLTPESIDTHELVWERYANDWLRTSVSSYWYKADSLITLTPDASAALGNTFVNEGHVRASGVELEAQMRVGARAQGLISYALQRAKDLETGTTLVNSPRQLAKMRFSIRGPVDQSFVSFELQYIGSRRTIDGVKLGDAATANVTVVAPLGRSFEVVGSMRNLFSAKYSDPVSGNHEQDSITQNGRTIRIGLRWNLGATP